MSGGCLSGEERADMVKAIVIVGIPGEPPFQPDIAHEEVAEAAGTKLKEVIALGDKGKAIAVDASGLMTPLRTSNLQRPWELSMLSG